MIAHHCGWRERQDSNLHGWRRRGYKGRGPDYPARGRALGVCPSSFLYWPTLPGLRGQGYPSVHTNNSEIVKQPRCALSTGSLYLVSQMSSVISPVPWQYLQVACFQGCIPVPPQCGQMIGSRVSSFMAQSFMSLATPQVIQLQKPKPAAPRMHMLSLNM